MSPREFQISTDTASMVVGDSEAIARLVRDAASNPEKVEEYLADLGNEPCSGQIVMLSIGSDGVFAVTLEILGEPRIGQFSTASNRLPEVQIGGGSMTLCAPEDIVAGNSEAMEVIKCSSGVYGVLAVPAISDRRVLVQLALRESGEQDSTAQSGMKRGQMVQATGPRNMLIGFTLAGATLATIAFVLILGCLRVVGSVVSIGPWYAWTFVGGFVLFLFASVLILAQRKE